MKTKILTSLAAMREHNEQLQRTLTDTVSVIEYQNLTYTDSEGRTIWTDAFQRAVDEHEKIIIPHTGEPYYVDRTIVIPSNRFIAADKDANIRKVPQMDTLLLRNRSVANGSHMPILPGNEDCNITVTGGIWEDTDENNTLYHGMYDSPNSMPGIDACFHFNNIKHLNVRNVKIIRAGGFGIQFGNAENAVIENIEFVATVADGVHMNGNTKNVIVRNISGNVADDIVAFNMYDWQRSSVCFGPIENVLCENITLAPEAKYKAIRILPGRYYYDDGSFVNGDLNNVIIRNVRGVNTFKFYFQTPAYKLGATPEKGEPGGGNNIFIEDVEINLFAPIDDLDEYMRRDPILGSFAGFEFGSHLGRVELRDISIRLNKSDFPTGYLACIGPKSARIDGLEIFDPDFSSEIEELMLENVNINGEALTYENAGNYLREIVFDNIYCDGKITKGEFKKVIIK